ncbi:SAM-dependent methyltransferase [Variovorax boronicumulans]|uniref:class I SAM-dependent methyltransferase n=1 Tax=Variovorax boronicumulans TaxID=436515 RepID=UPI002785D220|nr:methyltransferase domain-containing protein [Variovorax boronicumulans]MDQ0034566.1 SAM-dependent methyltransferase [Variovorax boronicumulans]
MHFKCNVCAATSVGRTLTRGDGRNVLFCENCDMGVVEVVPEDTSVFYEDTYYGATHAEVGYHDYEFTADHSLLWVKLVLEAISSTGRILDIGCANGHLLRSLNGAYERFGIEVNAAAAGVAQNRGVTIIASDVFDPAVSNQTHGSFDFITSIATFEHVNDFRGAFDVSLKSLQHDGVLIFEVPLMSYTRDNKDWLESSYEHVYYPTVKGMEALVKEFPDYQFTGFESAIAGYSSTYIGVAARDPQVFSRVAQLFEAMTKPSPAGLSDAETCINLAYNVVHSFNVTADRILALPTLVKHAYSFNLIKRLTQLWHSDRVVADGAAGALESAQWHAQQAKNWQYEWDRLHHDTEELKVANAAMYKQLQSLPKQS